MADEWQPRPRSYTKIFMLNSAEHTILNALKYNKLTRNSAFMRPDKLIMLLFLLINVEMPTIVGIITFKGRKNSMLS